MLLLLFLLFTLMPLLELWLLFQLSDVFGFWTTILVVLLTGMVGAVLAKMQGWHTMYKIQNSLRAGQLPAKEMGDGVLILVAGVLLITPGVITDIVGLSLLVPPIRFGIRKVTNLVDETGKDRDQHFYASIRPHPFRRQKRRRRPRGRYAHR